MVNQQSIQGKEIQSTTFLKFLTGKESPWQLQVWETKSGVLVWM